jgi:uncharacterized protein (TIGR02246 family)
MSIAYDEAVDVSGKREEAAIAALYEELITGWNNRDGDRFAASFTDGGTVIGFDGSEENGRLPIAAEMKRVFQDHETAAYVAKVSSIRLLSADVAVLRAMAGMIPAGQADLMPDRNAHHTLLGVKQNEEWRIALFQNTPAQFHGRPELTERLTAELRRVAN